MSATINRQRLNCIGCDSCRKTAGEMTCHLGISFDGQVPQRPPCYAHTTRRTPRLIVVEPTDFENLESAVSRQIQARSKGELDAGNCPEIRGHEIASRMLDRVLNTRYQASALKAITEELGEAFNQSACPITNEVINGFAVGIVYVMQRGVAAIRADGQSDETEGAEK